MAKRTFVVTWKKEYAIEVPEALEKQHGDDIGLAVHNHDGRSDAALAEFALRLQREAFRELMATCDVVNTELRGEEE